MSDHVTSRLSSDRCVWFDCVIIPVVRQLRRRYKMVRPPLSATNSTNFHKCHRHLKSAILRRDFELQAVWSVPPTFSQLPQFSIVDNDVTISRTRLVLPAKRHLIICSSHREYTWHRLAEKNTQTLAPSSFSKTQTLLKRVPSRIRPVCEWSLTRLLNVPAQAHRLSDGGTARHSWWNVTSKKSTSATTGQWKRCVFDIAPSYTIPGRLGALNTR